MKELSVKDFAKYLMKSLVALGLALPAVVTAQQAPQPTQTITFQDALGIAMKQNVTIKQAQNTDDLNGTAVQQARNQFLPDLRFNVNNGVDVGRNFSETEGRVVDQTTQSLGTGVSSSVTLFDGLKN